MLEHYLLPDPARITKNKLIPLICSFKTYLPENRAEAVRSLHLQGLYDFADFEYKKSASGSHNSRLYLYSRIRS
jgi:hypothetical protein